MHIIIFAVSILIGTVSLACGYAKNMEDATFENIALLAAGGSGIFIAGIIFGAHLVLK